MIGEKFVTSPDTKLRSHALSPKTITVKNEDITVDLVLYNVEGIGKIKALINEKSQYVNKKSKLIIPFQ